MYHNYVHQYSRMCRSVLAVGHRILTGIVGAILACSKMFKKISPMSLMLLQVLNEFGCY